MLVTKITVFLVFRQLKSKNRLQKRVQREKLALAHSGEVPEGGGELHIAVWSCNSLKCKMFVILQNIVVCGSMLVKCTLKSLSI